MWRSQCALCIEKAKQKKCQGKAAEKRGGKRELKEVEVEREAGPLAVDNVRLTRDEEETLRCMIDAGASSLFHVRSSSSFPSPSHSSPLFQSSIEIFPSVPSQTFVEWNCAQSLSRPCFSESVTRDMFSELFVTTRILASHLPFLQGLPLPDVVFLSFNDSTLPNDPSSSPSASSSSSSSFSFSSSSSSSFPPFSPPLHRPRLLLLPPFIAKRMSENFPTTFMSIGPGFPSPEMMTKTPSSPSQLSLSPSRSVAPSLSLTLYSSLSWWLGVLLYHLLAGFCPFFSKGRDTKSGYEAVRNGRYVSLEQFEFWKSVREEPKQLIKNLLIADPAVCISQNNLSLSLFFSFSHLTSLKNLS